MKVVTQGSGHNLHLLDPRPLNTWRVINARPRDEEDVTVTPLDSPLVPLFGGEKEDQSRDNNYFSSFPFLRRVVSWRSWLKGLDITYISCIICPIDPWRITSVGREDRRLASPTACLPVIPKGELSFPWNLLHLFSHGKVTSSLTGMYSRSRLTYETLEKRSRARS